MPITTLQTQRHRFPHSFHRTQTNGQPYHAPPTGWFQRIRLLFRHCCSEKAVEMSGVLTVWCVAGLRGTRGGGGGDTTEGMYSSPRVHVLNGCVVHPCVCFYLIFFPRTVGDRRSGCLAIGIAAHPVDNRTAAQLRRVSRSVMALFLCSDHYPPLTTRPIDVHPPTQPSRGAGGRST